MKAYGTRELVTLLSNLKYKKGKQIASRHLKYHCPKQAIQGIPTFILVMQNRTEFDRYWQREYIKQIKRHGFTQKEIDESWKK